MTMKADPIPTVKPAGMGVWPKLLNAEQWRAAMRTSWMNTFEAPNAVALFRHTPRCFAAILKRTRNGRRCPPSLVPGLVDLGTRLFQH